MTAYSEIVDSAKRAAYTTVVDAEKEHARALMVTGFAELAKAEQARISNLIALGSNKDVVDANRLTLLHAAYTALLETKDQA